MPARKKGRATLNESALDPRPSAPGVPEPDPDIVVLVSLVGKFGKRAPRIIEDGCGSGARLAALSAAFPGAEILGNDLDSDSSEVAISGITHKYTADFFREQPDKSADLLMVSFQPNLKRTKVGLFAADRILRPGGVVVVNEKLHYETRSALLQWDHPGYETLECYPSASFVALRRLPAPDPTA